MAENLASSSSIPRVGDSNLAEEIERQEKERSASDGQASGPSPLLQGAGSLS